MTTMERVTITLPAEQVRAIDALESNRSRFIAAAVAHELEARRRESLRASLAAPHPESAELAALGLSGWGDAADDDAGLVDPLVAESIAWEEGVGWVERK